MPRYATVASLIFFFYFLMLFCLPFVVSCPHLAFHNSSPPPPSTFARAKTKKKYIYGVFFVVLKKERKVHKLHFE
ncbi:hypothetical protein TRSC58_07369 [Trypanosoma rangeli SC58]|uniref:Secreted protein n=1 Tax=Trypanosoma rangeli SC58 TaxID=429131 RepID=A0A061ISY4_TRYRA|nr:hypothetical protein TRSC58_07369 [Trypanosoma rangeli SC58]